MTLKFHCFFGVPLQLALADRFGHKVEIEALEFIGAVPIEWRIDEGRWRDGLVFNSNHPLAAFHDLQVPVAGGTMGTPCGHAVLYTRGIGDALLMVWLREGTYSERKIDSQQLHILQPMTADSVVQP